MLSVSLAQVLQESPLKNWESPGYMTFCKGDANFEKPVFTGLQRRLMRIPIEKYTKL
jgi:hypothetical protein